MPRIEFVGVTKRYDSGEGLEPTNLVVEAGEATTILGPSGSGKTTLIRLIAGLENPDTGEILFDGAVMNDVAPRDRGLGLVVTAGALYDNLSAGRNLGFPLELAHVERSERRERVEQTAKRFRLVGLLSRRARELSAGQRQMVATGRATIRDNELVLFDEALAGVDPHLQASVKNRLRHLHDTGHTVVFATNHQALGMALATRLVVVRGGEVQQIGTPGEVYREPANAFVAQFLGEPGMNIVPVRRIDAARIRFGDDELTVGEVPSTRAPQMLAGVRPEHVWLAEPGTPFEECFTGRVTYVENLGHERLVHLAFGDSDSGSVDFVIRTATHGVSRGDRLELTIAPGSIAFFDPATEERLEPARV